MSIRAISFSIQDEQYNQCMKHFSYEKHFVNKNASNILLIAKIHSAFLCNNLSKAFIRSSTCIFLYNHFYNIMYEMKIQ